MENVKGKVAFITGGASGMGFGMAKAFCNAGMKVMIGDIEQQPMDRAVAELQKAGAEAACVKVDVSNRDEVFAAAEATIETFGKVHVLCNNAGVLVDGRSEKVDVDNWNWVVDVNLWGVVNGLQAFLPLIRSHGEEGHVVSTSSMAGMVNFRGSGPYNATKFAVVALSETLMEEHKKDNLGVSVLCPGAVNTKIAESGRNRQGQYGGTDDNINAPMAALLPDALDPDIVGRQVLEAILDDQPYIFTDPSLRRHVSERFRRLNEGFDWADNCEALK
ncbi:MAG: SDR family NAD(P)-dependent oxidoreductase [Pseudomonadales bacterium]|nr:SDR family NAD(P)-dependent oxidoreductase [Pseudomonadales bacterium]